MFYNFRDKRERGWGGKTLANIAKREIGKCLATTKASAAMGGPKTKKCRENALAFLSLFFVLPCLLNFLSISL